MAVFALAGCTGLEQFPEQLPPETTSYETALNDLDEDYAKALTDIDKATGKPEKQKRIRNLEIQRRLAVIDANFEKFQIALAQENVQVDFGVALVGIGVGGAGALVSETASQILSAVSGDLSGAQAAYGKAALYEKAISALLQQMIAGCSTMLAQIYIGRQSSNEDYPRWRWCKPASVEVAAGGRAGSRSGSRPGPPGSSPRRVSAAVHDLDAYYFAGSLPGAIVATSADAQVKNAEATNILREITSTAVTPEMFQLRAELQTAITGLDGAKAKALMPRLKQNFQKSHTS